ncbi:MAG: hypothetical protein PHN72_04320 [Bacilli bacterium]|nr:hypothetical protein [Bacilli bacterium]
MKNDEKINLVIQGEKTREELIYNNVIRNLHLSNADEVKYLKGKVNTLEDELKTRMMYTFILIFAFVTLSFGVILLAFDLYLLGIILIFSTFAFVVVKLILHFRSHLKNVQNDEFSKVDELKELLEKKLK